MVPDPAGDEDATVDILPELFNEFEGKKVQVTVEAV
jgi:hypothetical protein